MIKIVILTICCHCLTVSLFCQNRTGSSNVHALQQERILIGRDTVYRQLLRYRNAESYLTSPGLSYHTLPYFTDDSRQLLLEILGNNWLTREQKRKHAVKITWQKIYQDMAICERILSDTLKYGHLKKRLGYFRSRVDSLKRLRTLNVDTVAGFQETVLNYLRMIEGRKVPNEYIYTAGMLGDSRYIQVLEDALSDTTHYDQEAVKMALARYGVKPYSTEMIRKYQISEKILQRGKSDMEARLYHYSAAAPLLYLMSQESVKEYTRLLDMEHFDRIDELDYSVYSVPSLVLGNLSKVLLNTDFQTYISKVDPPDGVLKKHITWVQQWLKEHDGEYKLMRDIYYRPD